MDYQEFRQHIIDISLCAIGPNNDINPHYKGEPPLIRLSPFYPGQWGIRGTHNDFGSSACCPWCESRIIASDRTCPQCGGPLGKVG